MTDLGTSQRRDDDSGPEGTGTVAPDRYFRLWPPQVSWDRGELQARIRAVGPG